MYIKTIYHDEIVPLPLSKFLKAFNANRNTEKSPSERPKWAIENGKHYIYFHGRSGSGKGRVHKKKWEKNVPPPPQKVGINIFRCGSISRSIFLSN